MFYVKPSTCVHSPLLGIVLVNQQVTDNNSLDVLRKTRYYFNRGRGKDAPLVPSRGVVYMTRGDTATCAQVATGSISTQRTGSRQRYPEKIRVLGTTNLVPDNVVILPRCNCAT